MKHRSFTIDIFRSIAIIIVMLTHSLALFLGSGIINDIWNYLHFVVLTFIFCSGYVTASSFERTVDRYGILSWYRKRFVRLYIPYLLYCIVMVILQENYIFVQYVTSSLTLVGGIDIGWFTLLFLQLTLLTPVYIRLVTRKYPFVILVLFLEIIVFMLFLFPVSSVYSRLIAWIPWSLIYISGLYFGKITGQKHISTVSYPVIAVICLVLWLILYRHQQLSHLPLTLTLHKYPPDFYYLLYGIGINCLLMFLIQIYRKNGRFVTGIILFISKYSYEIFFLHLIILEIITGFFRNLSVFTVTGGSIVLTLIILKGWSLLLSFSKHNVTTVNKKR